MEVRDCEEQFESNPLILPDELNFMVIVGANNSGKSTVLRAITRSKGHDAYRVDVNRTVLKGEGPQARNYSNNYPFYTQTFRDQDNDNFEKQVQVLQDYFILNDAERKQIVDWYNDYFPNSIYEERENPLNSAPPMLLKVNGHSITKQGSGMRATLEIFIKLFDPSIKVLCIDEPELGLEPTLQRFLFQAIKDKSGPDKKVILATHSHHFLDRTVVGNNYICERTVEGKIRLSPANNLKNIIFRLLGNSLSSFLLPEKVLILEGPSDSSILSKTLELAGKTDYSIHGSGGIGNINYATNVITQFLQFNEANLPVYKDNITVIVDRPTQDIKVREWKQILGSDNSVCTLEKNGIEYYYPVRILQEIFDTAEPLGTIVDTYLRSNMTFNGKTLQKTELALKVAEKLTAEDLEDADNQLFQFVRNNL